MDKDKLVESLVAREIEKAFREGWAVGYNAGLRDGRSDGTYWCDGERDWRESETAAALRSEGERVTRPDPEMTSDRISGFLSAIMERTPNGEYIAVQYHPNGDWTVAAEASGLLSLQRERDELRALIRECRLADAHAARTGEEGRFDRAFHALCGAERAALTHVENEGK